MGKGKRKKGKRKKQGKQKQEAGQGEAQQSEGAELAGEQGEAQQPEDDPLAGEQGEAQQEVGTAQTTQPAPSPSASGLAALSRGLVVYNSIASQPVNRVARGLLFLVCGLLAVFLFLGRFLPALGTDTLIYHLATPATWLHEGFLSTLDFPFHDNGVEQSPMLTQMLFWLLMRVTGDDGLVNLVQPASFCALLWLYFRSARLLGASQTLSLLLTAGVVFFEPFLENLTQTPANNDLVMLTGCALTCYGLLITRRERAMGLLLGAAGAALMMLTKAQGLIVTVIALPAFGPALWQELRGPDGRWRWKVPAAVLGIGCLGAAFFWKNLVQYGNPLWPGTLKLGGVTLFDGLFDYSVLVDHGWAWSAIRPLVWDGKGDDVSFVALPHSAVLWGGWLGSLALTFLRPGTRKRAWTRAACCIYLPLAVVLLVLATVPFYTEPRYMFPAFYALWLAVANALALLIRLSRRELSTLLPAVCVALFLAGYPLLLGLAFSEEPGARLQFWGLAAVCGLPAAALTAQRRRRYGKLVLAGVAGLCALLAFLGPTWYPSYREQRTELRADRYTTFYPKHGWAWVGIDELSAEQPLTVAYAGTPMIFPLFGPRLQNRVVYVPVSAEDKPQPVDFSDKPADLPPYLWAHQGVAVARRRVVDDAFWLEGLREREVDVLYLAADPFRGGIEAELGMIARNPTRFELLHAEGETHVFRVLPPR